MNSGEKVIRNTKQDGRDVINEQLKEIQADWDRLIRKMNTAKVHLETSLLQWADYSSSYLQLQQLLAERENKLQQVCEQKVNRLETVCQNVRVPLGGNATKRLFLVSVIQGESKGRGIGHCE